MENRFGEPIAQRQLKYMGMFNTYHTQPHWGATMEVHPVHSVYFQITFYETAAQRHSFATKAHVDVLFLPFHSLLRNCAGSRKLIFNPIPVEVINLCAVLLSVLVLFKRQAAAAAAAT